MTWLTADARHVRLARQVDVWHDGAVFHFLTHETDRVRNPSWHEA